jgi:cyclase
MVSTFRHFTIESLGDGVWAAIHAMDPPASDAWAISNAGIVDLGDRTLLFDALTSTDAAAELRDAAEELTGRPPAIVVYSHAHYDHTWGASRFPEALVISSAAARAAMLAEGHLEVADFREVLQERLAFWSAADTDDDPIVRQDAPFFRPYWEGIAATLPSLELRYPDVAFDRRLEVRGRDRRVELAAVERAHAPGDVFMTVPDARVAFCAGGGRQPDLPADPSGE